MRIEQRGERLNLRGRLPSRNNYALYKTQRISLRLPATEKGLDEATKLIELVQLELKRNQFKWDHWDRDSSSCYPGFINL